MYAERDNIRRGHAPVMMQVEVAFWDTAGQERFHSLAPLYYRDADAALLVSGLTPSSWPSAVA